MELIVIAVLAVALVVLLGFLVLGRSGSRLSDDQFGQLVQRASLELAAAQSQALQQNSAQFLDLAETRLKSETAKGETLLRASAEQIGKSISQLREYVESTDRTRGESLASLGTVTARLGVTTGKLAEVLGSGPSRGQWGERMAEDILRLVGFVEGVQYQRQAQLEQGTGRPDFTFQLPQGLVLHMDVKFPLDAYTRYLEVESEQDRAQALRDFLRAVRTHVKAVTTRDYIDPSNGTLDYVLLFIPNEQVYGFIHDKDPALLDQALQQRVVLCSPCTLFAVLVVVRQSMDNFHLTQKTDEILSALGGFNQQWARFKDAMDAVGRRLESTQKSFRELVGVRRRALDRQVEKVESLRLDSGLEPEASHDLVPAFDQGASILGEGEASRNDEEGST